MTLTQHTHLSSQLAAPTPADAGARACLNCDAPLTGPYCATCGQPDIELAAPTWHAVREAIADVTDLNGRLYCTARALLSPGQLTVEFLRGRRAPYIGPLKLFLLAGTALSATWLITRGVDARYYGMRLDQGAGAYIDTIARGLIAASAAIALSSWVFGLARRRLLDETAFALHTIAAVAIGAAATTWLGTAWKFAWGTARNEPRGTPSLMFTLFLPAALLGVGYVAAADHRVHGGAWWLAALRALAFTAVTLAGLTLTLRAGL